MGYVATSRVRVDSFMGLVQVRNAQDPTQLEYPEFRTGEERAVATQDLVYVAVAMDKLITITVAAGTATSPPGAEVVYEGTLRCQDGRIAVGTADYEVKMQLKDAPSSVVAKIHVHERRDRVTVRLLEVDAIRRVPSAQKPEPKWRVDRQLQDREMPSAHFVFGKHTKADLVEMKGFVFRHQVTGERRVVSLDLIVPYAEGEWDRELGVREF